VDWIDTTVPTVEVSYSPDTLTSGNVVVTLRLNRTGTVLGRDPLTGQGVPTPCSEGGVQSGCSAWTKTFTSNWSGMVNFTDFL
jgi:hypothetical protein